MLSIKELTEDQEEIGEREDDFAMCDARVAAYSFHVSPTHVHTHTQREADWTDSL